ncbi:phospholipase D-like domain-containing protein [Lysobacter silvisoli]|uniref:Cardiolipin synthase B n=1 Tax=Lysobacter silvisoli TaxID=2293254 RepID=A0A371JWY8_9GAMM|nr:phospholipase D-like domain-containing protein [Lysobacter silvisoli]RDZ26172.1 cardiolipin synthase B [Lysobacter silvisoli]
MPARWTRRRAIWTVLGAVLLTAAFSLIALNLGGPEKQLAHAPPHRYPIASAQFRREMGTLLGPAVLPGNRVTALQNGEEIFPAMLQAIRSARRTITFETYIYWSGETGREFSRALSERARAGVQVYLTVDWLGSAKMDEDQIEEMERAGVRIRQYRPLAWYNLDRVNNRTHRKLLVVDGTVGFTGGVGIADQWRGHAQDPKHWRESHFRIEGPAVAQMQAGFNDNWVKSTGVVLHGPEFYPALGRAGDMDAQLFISSPAGGSDSMHLMVLMAIAASRQSIDLAAAYFVPDDLVMRALLDARRRGVRIRILVPGEHTDSDTVRLASKAQWKTLLQSGIEIHEYQPTMMHIKMLIVDRELTSVGSTNFDIRSFRLNDEASLNVYDRGFADAMTAVFESDLRAARRYTLEDWQQRPWSERLFEKFVRPLKSQL